MSVQTKVRKKPLSTSTHIRHPERRIHAVLAPAFQSLVLLKDPPRAPARAGLSSAATGSSLQSTCRDLSRHFLIPGQGAARAMASSTSSGSAPRLFEKLRLILGTLDARGRQACLADARVAAVALAPTFSLIRPAQERAASRSAGSTWGLERLGAPQAWSQGLTGKGVLVGHLDTGVDGRHPAFRGGAIRAFVELDAHGYPVNRRGVRDTEEHGTHTAGTILGRRVDGCSFGVAPGALLASAIVIEGGNVIERVLAGLEWAIDQQVRILNLSLGVSGFVDGFLVVIEQLRKHGILPVVAIGNEGAAKSRSPGDYARVLSVGMCDEADEVHRDSCSRSFSAPRPGCKKRVPDLVAPGVDVLSAIPRGRYSFFTGTSMATPHVAGLAALLMEARPAATAEEIEKAILASCRRPSGMSPARGHRGIPDAGRALEHLTGSPLARGTRGGSMRRSGGPASASAPRKKAAARKSKASGRSGRRTSQGASTRIRRR